MGRNDQILGSGCPSDDTEEEVHQRDSEVQEDAPGRRSHHRHKQRPGSLTAQPKQLESERPGRGWVNH